jgi:hypothetical protein
MKAKTAPLIRILLATLTLLLPLSAHCFYNPSTGRWLSRDPSGEKQDKNLYGFVANRPVLLVDIDGRGWPDGPMGKGGPPGPRMPELPSLNDKNPGFEMCRRDAIGDDICTQLANMLGGIHTFVRRTSFDAEGKPKHDGWGFDDANKPRPEPPTMDPLINPRAEIKCASCSRTSSQLQYGATQKTGLTATDQEIWDCVKSVPNSHDYSCTTYNCRSYAHEAASKCGLSCPDPRWMPEYVK